MSGGLSVEQHIDTVDAFARTLFLRSRDSSSSISDAVRQLHVALRHLRSEASDPDSPLRSDTHISQVRALVEECGASLRQLEGALNDGRRGEQLAGSVRRLRERIDDFLDGVQLQSRAAIVPVDQNQSGLEGIKDKVDVVANRIFARRDSGFSDDEDGLWREFKTELEHEGFSADVLKKHKEVLRAYIRGLETMSSETGGPPPTVRGLLECGADNSSSPKEMYPAIENEKFAPSMKNARRMPDEGPPPVPPKEPFRDSLSELPSSPQPRQSFSSDGSPRSSQSDSMALISTKDLMAMDTLHQGMGNMQLSPQGHQQQYVPPYGDRGQRYLPSPQIAGHLTAPPEAAGELAGSPNSMVLGSSPLIAPPPHHAMANSQSSFGQSPRSSQFRLAPDRYGNEIPMDAQWTRIKRERVSVEVLERAGVRYEARPTYVAILGRLSREQVEDLIRQTTDIRAARELRYPSQHRRHHDRADSKSSHDDDDDDSDHWNGSDTTDYDDDKTSDKGTRNYPYIVSPPEREKGSPSSTVPPKSILKNKNENHVHFGRSPYETEKTPRSMKDDLDGDRETDRDRRERRRRTSNRNDRNDRYYNDRDRYSSGRDRERSSRQYYDNRDREYHSSRRPQNRDRERSDREFDRRSKKMAWGETLGAVGLGGAAVSLLGVLAEAASAV